MDTYKQRRPRQDHRQPTRYDDVYLAYDEPPAAYSGQQSPRYDADQDSPEVGLSQQIARDRARNYPGDIGRNGDSSTVPLNANEYTSNRQYTEEPESIGFNSLRLSDPVPRPSSALSHGGPNGTTDPIPRSASAAPRPRRGPPPHASNPTNQATDRNGYAYAQGTASRTDVRSVHSVHSAGSARTSGSGYERDVLAAYGNDVPPVPPIIESGKSSLGIASNYPPSIGYGRQGPPQQSYMPPPQIPYNDPLYNAASDVLGLPPGAVSPPPPQQYPQGYPDRSLYHSPYPSNLPPPAPALQQNGYYPQPSLQHADTTTTGYSSVNSTNRANSVRDVDIPGPSPGMSRPTTKVVDVNQPPYTKEYIDQYRARLKGDPDPETHFGFAKYLIEAAMKVGANARDQRAVRKYRDVLITESVKVIRRLATQGETYPEAQFFLANCYGTGMLGLEVDHERAYQMYLHASKQNHPQGSYRVAVCNEIGVGTKRDHGRACAFYRKAATLGDTAAMYKLGMILLTGSLGQAKNPKEALIWLRRAAEQADTDNPHALHELGLLYEPRRDHSGLVIPDEVYAKELFTQAAQLGYAQSQFKLGQCYEYGTLGCPLDPKRSIAWYSKAAEKNDAEAELALSGWYLTGSEGVLEQSDSEAYLWARRAAQKALNTAEYAVGYYTEMGIGVKQDLDTARRWYMRATAQGNDKARARLTELKRGAAAGGRRARPTRQQAKDEGCVIQ